MGRIMGPRCPYCGNDRPYDIKKESRDPDGVLRKETVYFCSNSQCGVQPGEKASGGRMLTDKEAWSSDE